MSGFTAAPQPARKAHSSPSSKKSTDSSTASPISSGLFVRSATGSPTGNSSARLRRFRPDIVHTHSGKAGFIGRLAAKRAGVPKIIHSIHGPSFGPFQGWASNALFRGAERFAGRMTDHFVTVADAMRDQYLAAGISQADDYTRIPSGFDLQPFLDAENSPQNARRLACRRATLSSARLPGSSS